MMDFRYELEKRRTKLKLAVAWLLPRWLVEAAGIRLWANATTGAYSSVEAPAVTMNQAIGRWQKGDGGDRAPDLEKLLVEVCLRTTARAVGYLRNLAESDQVTQSNAFGSEWLRTAADDIERGDHLKQVE